MSGISISCKPETFTTQLCFSRTPWSTSLWPLNAMSRAAANTIIASQSYYDNGIFKPTEMLPWQQNVKCNAASNFTVLAWEWNTSNILPFVSNFFACEMSKVLLNYIFNLDLRLYQNGNLACEWTQGGKTRSGCVSMVINLCFCHGRKIATLSTRHLYFADTAVFLNMKHSNSGRQLAAAWGPSSRAEVHLRLGNQERVASAPLLFTWNCCYNAHPHHLCTSAQFGYCLLLNISLSLCLF